MFSFFLRRKRCKDAPPVWERKPQTGTRVALVAGRRHLTDVPYALPKDTGEINRLDFQHYLLRQVLRANYLAPISVPTTILDVGCGTGVWGKELAIQFPGAQVYGTDLEPFKATGIVPDNYHFIQGNLLEKLPFADQTFDFTHQRLLVAAIPVARWPDVLRELLRVTTSGGWIELAECGVEVHPLGPLTKQFFAWGLDASAARGLDARVVPYLDKHLSDAGTRNVRSKALDIPIGEWGGRIGTMMKQDLLAVLTSLKALYLERGATEDAFAELLKQLPREWEYYHSKIRFFVFYGQK
jgi:ubiquinone/menaquinone biosynthesis C-methylase UbiE